MLFDMGVFDALLIDGTGVSAADLVEKLQVDEKLISKLLNLRLSYIRVTH
jgi:plasmid maintenance system antidote protein VapI